jgi:hypothetical protein
VHHPGNGGNLIRATWPDLAVRPVSIGGVTVSYAQAEAVASLLAASRTSAIAPVLAHAGSPLAGCDYRGAAAPHLAAARTAPKTGKSGAAGRHVTKNAFLATVSGVLEAARAAAVGEALDAFAADERYMAEVAREAVAVRERAHVTAIRSRARLAADRAAGQCNATPGLCCNLATACGTGLCRFADPEFAAVTASAGPGRIPRPSRHSRPGTGFSISAAVAETAAAHPWTPAVYVTDSEVVRCNDGEAAA